MDHIIFRSFRAIDDQETCRKFLWGHQKVLEDYGITNITTNTQTWFLNPGVYGVVAESLETGVIVGGIRIHMANSFCPLPVEDAVGDLDQGVHDLVSEYRIHGGVGELCALWNDVNYARRGLSVLLTRAGISITNQLGFQTLMGICADYTLPMFSRVGFEVDHSLGHNGEFAYPDERYIARVLGIMNASTLDTAHAYDRERMISLRSKPVQMAVEKSKNGELDAEYQLKLSLNKPKTIADSLISHDEQ